MKPRVYPWRRLSRFVAASSAIIVSWNAPELMQSRPSPPDVACAERHCAHARARPITFDLVERAAAARLPGNDGGCPSFLRDDVAVVPLRRHEHLDHRRHGGTHHTACRR